MLAARSRCSVRSSSSHGHTLLFSSRPSKRRSLGPACRVRRLCSPRDHLLRMPVGSVAIAISRVDLLPPRHPRREGVWRGARNSDDPNADDAGSGSWTGLYTRSFPCICSAPNARPRIRDNIRQDTVETADEVVELCLQPRLCEASASKHLLA